MRFRQKYSLLAIFLLFVSAFVIYFGVHQYIRYSVRQFLILSSDAKRYPDWVDIKGDLKVEIWFWNITNPQDLKSHKAKIKEVGPFVYKISRHKHDVNFINKSSISYSEQFVFDFQHSLSVADETEYLTVFNFAALSILSNIDTLPRIIRNAISLIIQFLEKDESTGTMFAIKRNVHDILFGFRDPFLHAVKTKIPFFSDLNDVVKLLDNPLEDYMTIASGASLIPTQTVLSWKNITRLSYFKNNPYCNFINGTDGNLFTVPLKKKLQLFLPDLCRTIEIERESTLTAKNNLRGIYNYRLAINNSKNTECSDKYAGTLLFDLPCVRDAPVVISNPHFLYADPKYYRDFVSFLNPNDADHMSRLSIDSLTGYPLKVNKRVQINFQSPEHSSDLYTFTPNQLYPVLWMNQSYNAREQDIADLQARVHLPSMITTITALILFAGAILLALFSGIVFLYTFYTKYSSNEDEFQDEIDEESSENDPLIHNAY